MAVMVPVAQWFDGTEGGNFMRFTESWRSVKTDGWGISVAGVEGAPEKLEKALAICNEKMNMTGRPGGNTCAEFAAAVMAEVEVM